MMVRGLIDELCYYPDNLSVVFRFDGLEYGNIEIQQVRDELIIDVDLLNEIDREYLEINE